MGEIIFLLIASNAMWWIFYYRQSIDLKELVVARNIAQRSSSEAVSVVVDLRRQLILAENELRTTKTLTLKPEEPKNKTIRAGTSADVRKEFDRAMAKEEKNV